MNASSSSSQAPAFGHSSSWRQLEPWSAHGEEPAASAQLWGLAMRTASGLRLGYRLTWTPAAFTPKLQPPAATSSDPQRMDGLWQHTCFEAFLGISGSNAYWEFNLSPSLDWNVYRFTSYRKGQQADPTYACMPLQVIGPRSAPAAGDCRLAAPRAMLELELTCALPPDLDDLVSSSPSLDLGLSAVLEARDGALSYWALNHPGTEPDFHDRRGLSLRL